MMLEVEKGYREMMRTLSTPSQIGVVLKLARLGLLLVEDNYTVLNGRVGLGDTRRAHLCHLYGRAMVVLRSKYAARKRAKRRGKK